MACRTGYCPGCDAIVDIAEGRCWPHAHLVGYPVLPADPRQTAGPAQSTFVHEARETGGASPNCSCGHHVERHAREDGGRCIECSCRRFREAA